MRLQFHVIGRLLRLKKVLAQAWHTVFVGTVIDGGRPGKIAVPRRRRHRPFQGVGVPRIRRGFWPVAQGDDNVPDKEEGCEAKADRADCGDLIQGLELPQVLVNERIRDPAHHSPKTKIVHREESRLKNMKVRTNCTLPHLLVEHSAEHFREPEIEGAEERHDAAREEDVMDVSDDEVGVVDEQVHRRRSHEDAAQAADDEHRNEGQGKDIAVVNNLAAPDRSQPVEDFIAEGTAMIIVATENAAPSVGFMPLTNM